jgi:hyperosmotically inducible periplasmic protein
MKKSLLKLSAITMLACATFVGFESCKGKPKDADLESAISAKASSYPGLTASVKYGVATLSGTNTDETAKSGFEAEVKTIEGVKSVVNNRRSAHQGSY